MIELFLYEEAQIVELQYRINCGSTINWDVNMPFFALAVRTFG